MTVTNQQTLLNELHTTLAGLASTTIRDGGLRLLNVLGYKSQATNDVGTISDFLETLNASAKLTERQRETLDAWVSVEIIFQFATENFSNQLNLFKIQEFDDSLIRSFLFLAVELEPGIYSRTKLGAMSRAVNKLFPMPVITLFRYDRKLTVSVVHRRAHSGDDSRDVLEKITLIKDICLDSPHRAHLEILSELALSRLYDVEEVKNFDDLHAAWEKVVNTEELNKRFYRRLFEWFNWAVNNCKFPDDGAGSDSSNERQVIRLITRLLFIWFLKEKGVIPDELFDDEFARQVLKNHSRDRTDYYRAVLQNLFFATLNTEIRFREYKGRDKSLISDAIPSVPTQFERQTISESNSSFHPDFDNTYRYESLIADTSRLIEIFNVVPFVNGGLFDCLDNFGSTSGKGRQVDAFTDEICDEDLNVPAELFFNGECGLFSLFRHYKFTVEENTPLDQEVALDPELLGRVFENLLASYNPETRTTARKITGSYYTPRSVVDYMVDESLIATFVNKVPSYDNDPDWFEERLRLLLSFDQDDDTSRVNIERSANTREMDHLIVESEIGPLITAIDILKILDPACGSGAFPMGVLQKLVLILSKLDPQNKRWEKQQLVKAQEIQDPSIRKDSISAIKRAFAPERAYGGFGRKLYLIQSVIHGVDIQPIACEIAKLRFFITLVIEQQTNKEIADNYGVESLPNLETRFVAADFLLSLDKPKQTQIRNIRINEIERELKEIRLDWFNARDRSVKVDLKDKDKNLRYELKILLSQDNWSDTAAESISSWLPYDQGSRANWFDSEWMFGNDQGFDIIIGNPPYIPLQQNSGKLRKQYIDEGFQTFASTGDIYQLFCEKSCHLLSSNCGFLSFITSNSWLKADYGKKLRCFFSENHTPIKLVELGNRIFENAIVDTCIILARNGQYNEICSAIDIDSLPGSEFPPQNEHWKRVRPNGEKAWSILSPIEWQIKEKIEEIGTPLKEWDISIYFGIKTGYNDAFIIDNETKEGLIREDQKSTELLKPILQGRDIRKYHTEWAGRWLIDTHNGYGDVSPVKINDYNSVKRHLDEFISKLESRRDQGVTPYNLRNCAYHEEFGKEKIVWKRIGSNLRFSYCKEPIFCLDSTCIATGTNLKFLTGLLNSRMTEYQLSNNAPETGTGDLIISVQAIEPLLVPIPNRNQEQEVVEIFESILKCKISNACVEVTKLEFELDQAIYNLYGLDQEEKQIINQFEIPI